MYVAEDLVWRHRATELENTKDIVLLSSAIERVKATPDTVTNSDRIAHEVLVRPSDTDHRRIAFSHRTMQFFEDATSGKKVPDVVYIEYLHEVHSKSRYDLVGVPSRENGGQEVISFLIDRDTGATAARTYVSWISKTLTDGV